MSTDDGTNATRPSNPREISFDRSCFKQVGTRTVYSVAQSALHSGPKKFGEDREAAEAFARRCARTVSAHEEPVMRRIRWRSL